MSPWLLSALQLLRSAAIGTPSRALITGAGAGFALDDLGGEAGGILGTGLFAPGGHAHRRRRRRRALSASDKTDLAFLAAFTSKAGIERIAALMVAKS